MVLPHTPVVLLLGISSWQFVTESTNVGLRSVVDRGDLLRKIHFPNYIVVVSATVGALISYAINLVVVLIFCHYRKSPFHLASGAASSKHHRALRNDACRHIGLMATMYVYFVISPISGCSSAVDFLWMPIIYPLTYVTNRGGLLADIARLELINPFAQAIQDIRHNFIAPETQPTVWNQFNNWGIRLLPIALTVVLLWLGVCYSAVIVANSRRLCDVRREKRQKNRSFQKSSCIVCEP